MVPALMILPYYRCLWCVVDSTLSIALLAIHTAGTPRATTTSLVRSVCRVSQLTILYGVAASSNIMVSRSPARRRKRRHTHGPTKTKKRGTRASFHPTSKVVLQREQSLAQAESYLRRLRLGRHVERVLDVEVHGKGSPVFDCLGQVSHALAKPSPRLRCETLQYDIMGAQIIQQTPSWVSTYIRRVLAGSTDING